MNVLTTILAMPMLHAQIQWEAFCAFVLMASMVMEQTARVSIINCIIYECLGLIIKSQ